MAKKQNSKNKIIDNDILTEMQKRQKQDAITLYVWALVLVMVIGLALMAYIFWNKSVNAVPNNGNAEYWDEVSENNITTGVAFLAEKKSGALDFSPSANKNINQAPSESTITDESSLEQDIEQLLDGNEKIEETANVVAKTLIDTSVDITEQVKEEKFDVVSNFEFETWSDEKKQKYLEALEREEEDTKLLKAISAAETKVKAEEELKHKNLALEKRKAEEELAKAEAEKAKQKTSELEIKANIEKQQELEAEVKKEQENLIAANKKAEEAKIASLEAEKEAAEANKKADEASKTAEKVAISNFWVVNISSTTDKEESDRILKKLQANNLNTTVYRYEATVEEKKYYRIRAGFFETRENAEKMATLFSESHKLTSVPWVVQPNAGEISTYRK